MVLQILLPSSSRCLRTFSVSFSFFQPVTELTVTRKNHITNAEILDAKRPIMSPYVPEIQRTRAISVLMEARKISCTGRPKERKFWMAKAAAALPVRGSMWILQMTVMMVARADCATARTIRPWYL